MDMISSKGKLKVITSVSQQKQNIQIENRMEFDE